MSLREGQNSLCPWSSLTTMAAPSQDLQADATQPLPGGRTHRALPSEEWLQMYLSRFLLLLTNTGVPPHFLPGLVSLQLPRAQRLLNRPVRPTPTPAPSRRPQRMNAQPGDAGPPQLPSSLCAPWPGPRSDPGRPQILEKHSSAIVSACFPPQPFC